MEGVKEFVDFCRDEFWDLDTLGIEGGVYLEIDPGDPRRDKIVDFLAEVRDDVGIVTIEREPTGIYVEFDQCGALYPRMIFRVRSTFANPAHIESARVRDRKDDLGLLELYAAQGRPFTRGLIHPAIRRIQWALSEHGFQTPLDGKWGLKTRFQLWRFRRRHGLPTLKHIDRQTIEALEV